MPADLGFLGIVVISRLAWIRIVCRSKVRDKARDPAACWTPTGQLTGLSGCRWMLANWDVLQPPLQPVCVSGSRRSGGLPMQFLPLLDGSGQGCKVTSPDLAASLADVEALGWELSTTMR